jgi:hypothetical protein
MSGAGHSRDGRMKAIKIRNANGCQREPGEDKTKMHETVKNTLKMVNAS